MAGEPESLYSDEPLKERIRRHDYDRLLMLSDGVFAIAITLLALELALPRRWDGSIEQLMSTSGRPLIGYLFGFLLVGVFWFIHRRLFARLEQVDAGITVLNLLLLGLVGLTPYVARMIAEAGPTRAMPFYFVALGCVFGAVALIRAWAAMHPGLLHPDVEKHRWTSELLVNAVTALVLIALGGWTIFEHRPINADVMIITVLLVAGGRQVIKRSRRQTSSTSRP